MRAPLLLIADYAYADPGGRLHAIGAGLDSLSFPSFPATVSQLSVAVKMVFDRDDPQPRHLVEVALRDESKRDVGSRREVPVRITQSPDNRLLFVWNLQDVTFHSPGMYQAVLLLDGEVVAEADLGVRLAAVQHPLEQFRPEIDRFLEAYQAVRAGEYAHARSVLEELAVKNPERADIQVGLGFVLLASDRPQEAMSRFETAERIGFPRNEMLLLTDIGVALYRQQRYPEALASFQRALKAPTMQTNALLIQIDGPHMVVVEVKTVPDVIALIALNGAWAAWNMGDRETTSHLMGLATESSMQGTSEDGTVRSLSELRRVLIS